MRFSTYRHLDDLAEAAELIVSELITNAVRASTAPDGRPRYDGAGMPVVVLRMASDGFKLLVEVWDVIPVRLPQRTPDPTTRAGAPMLVAAQCDRWSWQTVPGWPGKAGLGRTAQLALCQARSEQSGLRD